MHARERWRRARELASLTRACLTAGQLRDLGIGRGSIAHRLKTGELIAMFRGVYCFGPIPPEGAEEMAATLACRPRSCASHTSATYLNHLPPHPAQPRPIHVTVSERRVRRRGGIAIHHTTTLIRSAQLPHPQVNAPLHGYEVDLLWPDHRLVVEVDALSTHSDPRTFERDRKRDAELTLRGYTVLRVTRRQIDAEPEAVIARIAAALAMRRVG